MTLYFDEIQDTKSIIGADSEVETVSGEDVRTSPKFSKSFLEYMEDTFDIRKMVNYEDSIEKIKGVQSVLDHMRLLYENDFKI